jgi:ABC-type antimicrobial peptide transport system permease subunit
LFFQVFIRALLPALIGLAVGLVTSFVVGWVISNYLFGIQPTDPFTYAAVTLILIVVMAIACAIPARRAAQIDPLVALRQD